MRHDVVYRRDPDGTPVVGVLLTNKPARAWLYRADYEALRSTLGFTSWFIHRSPKGHEYVCVNRLRKVGPVTVARLITKAAPRRNVRHLNGDRLDLRAANLTTIEPLKEAPCPTTTPPTPMNPAGPR